MEKFLHSHSAVDTCAPVVLKTTRLDRHLYLATFNPITHYDQLQLAQVHMYTVRMCVRRVHIRASSLVQVQYIVHMQ